MYDTNRDEVPQYAVFSIILLFPPS